VHPCELNDLDLTRFINKFRTSQRLHAPVETPVSGLGSRGRVCRMLPRS
jgi:hypothetical protein